MHILMSQTKIEDEKIVTKKVIINKFIIIHVEGSYGMIF